MSASAPDQPSHVDGELPSEAAGSAAPAEGVVPIGSPVASESPTPAQEWQELCSLEDIPDGGILTRLQAGQDLLLYRNGLRVTCMPNECPHRGWPFDGGPVRGGVLICPFHGYEFRLDTGECLTSPSLSLDMYPIRVSDGRVEVRLK